jgi:nicotinamide-nucleotide amidase
MENLAQEVGDLLIKHKFILGTVESATGGLISHLITYNSGSSEYFKGGIVSYSNDIKNRLVGVKPETLEKFGAVSAQVATEMAEGGRKALGVDICVVDTGIAGPTGATLGKPVGLFYLGLSHKEGSFNRKFIFRGSREDNKELAALAALNWVKEYLLSLDSKKESPKGSVAKQIVTSFILSENKILLLRRSNIVGNYKGDWGAISGYIEKNSAYEQALQEIKEETGLDNKELKLIGTGHPLEVQDEKLKINWLVHPFLFYVRYQDKIKLDAEHVESRWIMPSELENFQTVPKLKEALDLVMTSKKLDE